MTYGQVESEWAKGQKEARIIDTLEPVMTQHRLVLDESLARSESRSEEHKYSLLYQLTHITRDRGSLRHDDRLDALAGAVAYYMRSMAQNVDQAAQAVLETRLDEEIEDFMEWAEGGLAVKGRGKRRAGYRVETHRVDL